MGKSDTTQQDTPGFLKRLRESVIADPVIPRTPQERRRYPLRNLLLHFRPATVPARTLRFSLTWGLGGMAVVLVAMQFLTGILLKFVYEPVPVSAYASVLTLINEVPFGRLIRNLHHWCAHLLVIVIVLHLMRVFFTGAFQPPRQFNWIIGLLMLATILAANFTGYLLPWDQLAYWAVTVATGMLEYLPGIGPALQSAIRGGTDIGPATLHLFYALHTAMVPLCLGLLMAFHFWRIRKAGGLVIPRSPGEEVETPLYRVATLPHLITREIVVATVLVALVLLWSAVVDAPLEQAANPGLSPNPTKAPWYFAGLQELLMQLPPVLALAVVPAILVLFLLSIPYWPYDTNTQGVWFGSQVGRKSCLLAIVTGLVLIPLWVYLNDLVLTSGPTLHAEPRLWVGLMPLAGLLGLLAGFVWAVQKRLRLSRQETLQIIFTLLLTGIGVLTLSGIWFRGTGMALTLPW